MAKYSWAKNIETGSSNGYGIGIDQSFRCTVRDSYIHSTINPTPAGAGYGLEFSWGSADNLAENNISWNFDKVMVMRASGGGKVMAYNCMDDGWIAHQPNWVESGINAAHMTMPHFELFERNLTFALGTDDRRLDLHHLAAQRGDRPSFGVATSQYLCLQHQHAGRGRLHPDRTA